MGQSVAVAADSVAKVIIGQSLYKVDLDAVDADGGGFAGDSHGE